MDRDNIPYSDGEVSGAFLLGMLESFSDTHIFPPELIPFPIEGIKPDAWYPYSYLIKLNILIEEEINDSDSILFWAGVRFMNLWYWHGPGKDLISSGLDWVYCNDTGGGYNSVVRGNNIGWCRNRTVDEEQGFALIENVAPMTPAYMRGIFFGGFYLFDDMAYFNTEVEQIENNVNYPFQCTVIKLIFRPSNPSISKSRLKQLRCIGYHDENCTEAEAEELLWRYRHQLNLSKLQRDYSNNILNLTSQAYDKLNDLKDKLATEAVTDNLTGLYNKGFFNKTIGKTLNSAKRECHSVCVMMIDIDYFKLFNDHYGHIAGDHAIQAVAKCIESKASRGSDFVARFGGEEFVVILVDVDEDGVRVVAEKMHESLKKKQIPHEKSKICPYLTMSIGSVIGDKTYDVDALLKNADEALYRAKDSGRNCHFHTHLPHD
ncbi:GGDEF domain-containing protein [Vibrio caribbeanicus]|uniref:GGDEF domain-containing protein n=1 Tax=Vibrio caribbeanicus TaxID=701175 RepID=UPI0030DA0379